jgi:hypothetical protein
MSKQTINIGASPNDGTGTPLRTSFDYTNQNFTEIYTALGGGVALPGATTQVIFNDGGTNLAGDAGLVYNKTTDALTVAGLVTAGSATITGAATVGTTLGVTGNMTVLSTGLIVNTTGVGVGVTPTNNLHVKGASGSTAIKIEASTDGLLGFIGSASGLISGSPANNIAIRAENGLYLSGNGNATQFILNSAGNVTVSNGNVVIGTSGKGIDFSAVTGGTGTATANVLNDYEEGTFTPTVTSEFGTIGTTTVTSATYTKIGRLVSVNFDISIITAGTGSGSLLVSVPFNIGEEACGAGRETAIVGNMCQVFRQSATAVGVRFYNNLTPIANLNRFFCSYTYSV